MQKIDIFIFNKHIGTMYQDGDKVYLKQVENLCSLVSPLAISSDIRDIETTKLKHLESVAGFISDSLPGKFGNELLEEYFLEHLNKTPTVSDKLMFIANQGLGALEFRPSSRQMNDLESNIKVKELFDESKKLKRGSGFHPLQNVFILSAHSFVGGARSKAVCAINLEGNVVFIGDRTKPLKDGFMHVIIKYDDISNDDEDRSTYSKVEYIYYLLAIEAGIHMSDSYLIKDYDKEHFVTKRFDIDEKGKKLHVHSLAGLLHYDYNEPMGLGYEDLFRTAIRLDINSKDEKEQLFMQMLFNYMFVNQDDHSRNFSFMCDSDFKWHISPAYDITFAKGKKQTVEHQLSLYEKPLSKIGIDDIVKLATEFSIDIEFVEQKLTLMKYLRENKLPKLLEQYRVRSKKRDQVLNEVNKRDLQGALNE